MRYGYRIARFFCQWFSVLLLKARVYGRHNVPASGSVVYISNHQSFLDPMLMSMALRRPMNYMARDTLFRSPVFRWMISTVNAFPVKRGTADLAAIKEAMRRLKAGGQVVIFAEGTRTRDGRIGRLFPGVSMVVIKSACPVVPVRVFGSFEAYGRHMRFPLPKPVVVKFGLALDFVALRTEARTCSKERLKAIYQQVADEIMDAIARLEPCADRTRFP